MTIIQISVPVDYIEAALQCVSKEGTRYYLQGVFLDARGFVAATNGHMAFAALCAAASQLSDCTPSYGGGGALAGVIVPHDAITQAIKAAGRVKGLCIVFERDQQGQWWILYGNARVAFAPIDGSFPDWKRVVPEAPATLTAAHYNPQYIAAIGNMAKALNDGKKAMTTAFCLHQAGETPALVTFRNGDSGVMTDCVAVLMPIRSKPADYATTGHASAFRF
jgi:hypothetical protein